jgi:hypothetical protein
MKLIRIAILKEAKSRIKSDKDTFEYCGRKDTKGHFRAMMIIDELIKEIEQDTF